MPNTTHHPSPLVFRLILALTLLTAALPAAALPAVASAPAAASAIPAAASGTPAAPAASATIGLTAPPPVSVTPLPTPTITPTPAYPPTYTSSGVPRFEPGPCPFNLPAGAVEGKDVKCGTLVVPEEHADPSSPTLELAVAIVPANGKHPLADPVVFNQGGPGFGSIDTYVPFMLTSPFRTDRDQIAFDQRGTGYSRPALLCPEIITETIATLDVNLSPADSNARYNAAALQCRDRLVQAGVNLSAYNTQESAADITDLRQALGYPPLNLYGVSYGSLLVLDTLRFHPDSVRSAILDGVVPPQGNMNTDAPRSEDRAFTELFTACASDTTCRASYPNLSDVFFNLVAELNDHPATIRVIDPGTGSLYPALLTGDDFVNAVFQAMYQSDLIPVIPEIIRRATLSDFGALEPIIALMDLDRSWSVGMYWSVYCAEDADFNPAAISYAGIRPELAKGQDANNQAIKALCQAWNVRDLARVLNTPVTSTVPTLLLNGRFDPITPPYDGILASQTLSHSTVVTITTTAHGAFPAGGKCVSDMMSGFVDHPELDVDTRCVDTLRPITWDTPGNMVNFSVVGAANDLAARRPGLLVGVLALLLSVPVLLSSLLVFPIAWVVKRGAKPPDELAGMDPSKLSGADPSALMGGASAAATGMLAAPPKADTGMLLGLAPWLAVLSAVLPVAFVVAFILSVGPLIRSNAGVLLLGLPGSLTWVFLLPVINTGLVLLLWLASLLGMISKDWAGLRKLYFLLLSFAGFALVAGLGLVGVLTALLGQGEALVHGLLPF